MGELLSCGVADTWQICNYKIPYMTHASFLLSDTIMPPKTLQEFLALVITGKSFEHATSSTECVVNSLAEDLCQASCRGQWIMPKHLLLGMTLRHVTGSAEMVTLLHRFGHCSSYTCLTELETAMCLNITSEESSCVTGYHFKRQQYSDTHLLGQFRPSGADAVRSRYNAHSAWDSHTGDNRH